MFYAVESMDDHLTSPKSDRLRQEVCPVCMGRNLSQEREIRDHIGHSSFSVLKCRDCSLRFITDPPLPKTINKYYSNEAGTRMHTNGSSTHKKLRNILLKDEMKPLTRRLLKGSEIIDVGAGDGAVSALLTNMGYKVTAMDMHSEAEWMHPEIEYQKVDLNTPLPPYGPPGADRTTRAVVMRHVLEHLYDPVKMLLSMRYADVKYILIITPNYDSILRPLLGESWYFWDPPRHLTYFNQRSIYCLAERCGYKLVETSTYAIDELITSFHRKMLLNSTDKKEAQKAESNQAESDTFPEKISSIPEATTVAPPVEDTKSSNTNTLPLDGTCNVEFDDLSYGSTLEDADLPPIQQLSEAKVEKKCLTRKITEMTSPKSPLAALSSVVASFFGNCVIHAILERYKQPQGTLQ